MLSRVVFCDRDGVINEDSPDYIKNLSEFKFLPKTLHGLRMLAENGFSIIVITNQSAIDRGITTQKSVEEIHRYLLKKSSECGGPITDVFYCPHSPAARCGCRKPKPGLIEEARIKYDIHLSSAVMVGDSVGDIECGKAAGVEKTVLVLTGNGHSALSILRKKGILPDYIAADLLAAAKWIISNEI